jgi:5-methylcytosine-specific restriction endonuclease McrA
MGKKKRRQESFRAAKPYFSSVQKHIAVKYELPMRGLKLGVIAGIIAKETGWRRDSKTNDWELVARYGIEIRPNEPAELLERVKTAKALQTKKKRSRTKFSAFYQTREWRTLRMKAFLKYGRQCMCCNATDKVLHVDHVKPRSRFPHLELELSNLQILCEDCNMGKGGWTTADFRERTEGDQGLPDLSPEALTEQFRIKMQTVN